MQQSIPQLRKQPIAIIHRYLDVNNGMMRKFHLNFMYNTYYHNC